jgi:hypothetical protein
MRDESNAGFIEQLKGHSLPHTFLQDSSVFFSLSTFFHQHRDLSVYPAQCHLTGNLLRCRTQASED